MKGILVFSVFLLPFIAGAQQLFLPIDHESGITINRCIIQSGEPVHTSIRPLLSSGFTDIADMDSALYGYHRDSLFLSKRKHTWFWRKLRTEDFILVDTVDFFLAVNPMIDFGMGKEMLSDSSLSINTRGIMVKGNIGKQLSFYSDFYENQAFFPVYIHEYIIDRRVIPGQGRNRGFKGSGHDYASASGYLSYSPASWLNFYTGHSKNFIGEGYRSLLLSDYSFNYPFVRATLTGKRVQYVYMLSSHQEISAQDTRLLACQRKLGSFSFISFIPHKNLQIGLFEGMMWQSTLPGSNNHVGFSYFNPVIFSRILHYGLNDSNNVITGINTSLRIGRIMQLYGQFMLDNLGTGYTSDKYGWQAGCKIFNPFHLKNLYLQAEYNYVTPYAYAHDNVMQSYTNANEPLAHPLGANFNEFFSRLYFSKADFFADFRFSYAVSGLDYNGSHYGADIFMSDSLALIFPGDETFDTNGLKTEIIHYTITTGWIINPRTNLQLFATCDLRRFINKTDSQNSNCILFGIRTSLSNHYYDF